MKGKDKNSNADSLKQNSTTRMLSPTLTDDAFAEDSVYSAVNINDVIPPPSQNAVENYIPNISVESFNSATSQSGLISRHEAKMIAERFRCELQNPLNNEVDDANNPSTTKKNTTVNHKPVIVDEPASLTDDGAEADDENEKSDCTVKSKKFSRELNNLASDINIKNKDISSTTVVINGRNLRKRPSKEASPKVIQIKDSSPSNYIKKKVSSPEETVVLLNGNPHKKITSYLTPNKKIQKIKVRIDEVPNDSDTASETENGSQNESESDANSSVQEIESEKMEEVVAETKNEESKDDANASEHKMPKKRRRQSMESSPSRKKAKVKPEPSEENEPDKKITYKQSSLQGFSKLPSPSVRSFKPRKKSTTPAVKKVLPIPDFKKLESQSSFNRYTNLVITDILKLLSISDFLEKFGDCILELDQKINFYTLYQAIVYPTPNSFKLLSSIYVALLSFLKGKEETSNLIIPLNELTWQYYLIPTITETLRSHYRLKRNAMYNYTLPDYLTEIETNEFYRVSALAHVKTLQQLIAILVDSIPYRDRIESMIDKMIHLGYQRRFDIMERKNMEDEMNNMHRDVNIVGIRIKTLELEIKKQKEKEKEEISKSRTRQQRNLNTTTTIDHRSLSRLHSEYNKKVSALDKLKRSLKKKDESLLAKKKEKLDIKNKIFKGNDRFLGIDRNNRYYWIVDIKYTPKRMENEKESDEEEKAKKSKPKPLLSFITKDEKGKLALSMLITIYCYK
ncbi:hypothetical protein PIROE2DRAFT_59647 [Piromyces sp. E2]|nr:hypothetical protein PIROE2DRAFT_59647 [Piromyces sp. E2]|eukprot:OUM65997.1 hypothetical protein PIROE2DRAFT_59647 [Piromyces sp. E2]